MPLSGGAIWRYSSIAFALSESRRWIWTGRTKEDEGTQPCLKRADRSMQKHKRLHLRTAGRIHHRPHCSACHETNGHRNTWGVRRGRMKPPRARLTRLRSIEILAKVELWPPAHCSSVIGASSILSSSYSSHQP